MRIVVRVAVVAACLVAYLAPSLYAATYFVPPDAELIQKADAIVVATGVTSLVGRSSAGGIVTRYTLRVEESLKGDYSVGSDLVLTERGGALDGRITYIPGTPEYAAGVRYLVFTDVDSAMEPVTYGLALGQFHFASQRGRALLLRAEVFGFDVNLEQHAERARDAGAFLQYIRGIIAQRVSPEPLYFVDGAEAEFQVKGTKVAANATRTSYLMQASGFGFRWQSPSASFVKAGIDPGGVGSTAANVGFGQWNSTSSDIAYSDGGANGTATAGLTSSDGKNAILFGDPNNEVNGAAGLGGITNGDITYEFPIGSGEQFIRIREVDVVIEAGAVAQNCLNGILTHELGHTLGFRHSDTPPAGGVSSTVAIMRSSVACNLNGNLQTYDNDAASTVYGTGPVCNPASIGTQPPNRNVGIGEATTLPVIAGGTAPLTYQWFVGLTGNTSTPASGASATTSTLSVTPASAGVVNYWVRVSNSCGTPVNSNTATITATCAAPAISSVSSNVSIGEGSSAQLSVNATGSGLTFQWFVGTSGDTSNPISSANASTRTVSPTTTTSYWVRVNGSCPGGPVNSNTITVTVVACAALTVGAPLASPGATAGNYTLSLSASSTSAPVTIAWFRGGTPGFGGTQIGTGPSINTTVTLQMGPTLFWARVTNGCGRVEITTGITLAACSLPSITTQPADKTINPNETAPLAVVASAGTSVTWFRGVVGVTTDPILTGASVTSPPLATTTQFWAQVTNDCGSVSSRQVTITVRQVADLVPMLNGRFFVQVRYFNQFDNGKEGKLLGRSLSSTQISDTAIFTFGDPLVVELMVRLSDARPFENKIHLFLGGLSDVEFSVVVTDSLTGIIKEYRKPPNQLVGTIDRASFPGGTSLQDGVDALRAMQASLRVTPDAEVSTIRLLNQRYEVRMRYKNQFTNPAGEGFMNVRSIASSPTTETAVFFFDGNFGSVEWMVRFSDARPFAERIDFFHGGLSDVEFTIFVTDTVTGVQKEYRKGPFSLAGQVDRSSYRP